MADNKLVWHKVADNRDTIEWQANNLALAKAAGKTITLARLEDRIFACAHKCPHASGILADGFIDAAGNITCPLHRYKFDLQNGRNASGEGYYLKMYAIEERENGLYVGFEESGWLNIFK